MIMLYPSAIRFDDDHIPQDFQPSGHIFYAERVMDVKDGIPKWSGHKGQSDLMEEMDHSHAG
jgi:hypothetical protein